MGERTGTPSCAQFSHRFIFDPTTPVGKVLLAGLITNYRLSKTVHIFGTGGCLGHASETLQTID